MLHPSSCGAVDNASAHHAIGHGFESRSVPFSYIKYILFGGGDVCQSFSHSFSTYPCVNFLKAVPSSIFTMFSAVAKSGKTNESFISKLFQSGLTVSFKPFYSSTSNVSQ